MGEEIHETLEPLDSLIIRNWKHDNMAASRVCNKEEYLQGDMGCPEGCSIKVGSKPFSNQFSGGARIIDALGKDAVLPFQSQDLEPQYVRMSPRIGGGPGTFSKEGVPDEWKEYVKWWTNTEDQLVPPYEAVPKVYETKLSNKYARMDWEDGIMSPAVSSTFPNRYSPGERYGIEKGLQKGLVPGRCRPGTEPITDIDECRDALVTLSLVPPDYDLQPDSDLSTGQSDNNDKYKYSFNCYSTSESPDVPQTRGDWCAKDFRMTDEIKNKTPVYKSENDYYAYVSGTKRDIDIWPRRTCIGWIENKTCERDEGEVKSSSEETLDGAGELNNIYSWQKKMDETGDWNVKKCTTPIKYNEYNRASGRCICDISKEDIINETMVPILGTNTTSTFNHSMAEAIREAEDLQGAPPGSRLETLRRNRLEYIHDGLDYTLELSCEPRDDEGVYPLIEGTQFRESNTPTSHPCYNEGNSMPYNLWEFSDEGGCGPSSLDPHCELKTMESRAVINCDGTNQFNVEINPLEDISFTCEEVCSGIKDPLNERRFRQEYQWRIGNSENKNAAKDYYNLNNKNISPEDIKSQSPEGVYATSQVMDTPDLLDPLQLIWKDHTMYTTTNTLAQITDMQYYETLLGLDNPTFEAYKARDRCWEDLRRDGTGEDECRLPRVITPEQEAVEEMGTLNLPLQDKNNINNQIINSLDDNSYDSFDTHPTVGNGLLATQWKNFAREGYHPRPPGIFHIMPGCKLKDKIPPGSIIDDTEQRRLVNSYHEVWDAATSRRMDKEREAYNEGSIWMGDESGEIPSNHTPSRWHISGKPFLLRDSLCNHFNYDECNISTASPTSLQSNIAEFCEWQDVVTKEIDNDVIEEGIKVKECVMETDKYTIGSPSPLEWRYHQDPSRGLYIGPPKESVKVNDIERIGRCEGLDGEVCSVSVIPDNLPEFPSEDTIFESDCPEECSFIPTGWSEDNDRNSKWVTKGRCKGGPNKPFGCYAYSPGPNLIKYGITPQPFDKKDKGGPSLSSDGLSASIERRGGFNDLGGPNDRPISDCGERTSCLLNVHGGSEECRLNRRLPDVWNEAIKIRQLWRGKKSEECDPCTKNTTEEACLGERSNQLTTRSEKQGALEAREEAIREAQLAEREAWREEAVGDLGMLSEVANVYDDLVVMPVQDALESAADDSFSTVADAYLEYQELFGGEEPANYNAGLCRWSQGKCKAEKIFSTDDKYRNPRINVLTTQKKMCCNIQDVSTSNFDTWKDNNADLVQEIKSLADPNGPLSNLTSRAIKEGADQMVGNLGGLDRLGLIDLILKRLKIKQECGMVEEDNDGIEKCIETNKYLGNTCTLTTGSPQGGNRCLCTISGAPCSEIVELTSPCEYVPYTPCGNYSEKDCNGTCENIPGAPPPPSGDCSKIIITGPSDCPPTSCSYTPPKDFKTASGSSISISDKCKWIPWDGKCKCCSWKNAMQGSCDVTECSSVYSSLDERGCPAHLEIDNDFQEGITVHDPCSELDNDWFTMDTMNWKSQVSDLRPNPGTSPEEKLTRDIASKLISDLGFSDQVDLGRTRENPSLKYHKWNPANACSDGESLSKSECEYNGEYWSPERACTNNISNEPDECESTVIRPNEYKLDINDIKFIIKKRRPKIKDIYLNDLAYEVISIGDYKGGFEEGSQFSSPDNLIDNTEFKNLYKYWIMDIDPDSNTYNEYITIEDLLLADCSHGYIQGDDDIPGRQTCPMGDTSVGQIDTDNLTSEYKVWAEAHNTSNTELSNLNHRANGDCLFIPAGRGWKSGCSGILNKDGEIDQDDYTCIDSETVAVCKISNDENYLSNNAFYSQDRNKVQDLRRAYDRRYGTDPSGNDNPYKECPTIVDKTKHGAVKGGFPDINYEASLMQKGERYFPGFPVTTMGIHDRTDGRLGRIPIPNEDGTAQAGEDTWPNAWLNELTPINRSSNIVDIVPGFSQRVWMGAKENITAVSGKCAVREDIIEGFSSSNEGIKEKDVHAKSTMGKDIIEGVTNIEKARASLAQLNDILDIKTEWCPTTEINSKNTNWKDTPYGDFTQEKLDEVYDSRINSEKDKEKVFRLKRLKRDVENALRINKERSCWSPENPFWKDYTSNNYPDVEITHENAFAVPPPTSSPGGESITDSEWFSKNAICVDIDDKVFGLNNISCSTINDSPNHDDITTISNLCTNYNTDDFNANNMCCMCGGGKVVDDALGSSPWDYHKDRLGRVLLSEVSSDDKDFNSRFFSRVKPLAPCKVGVFSDLDPTNIDDQKELLDDNFPLRKLGEPNYKKGIENLREGEPSEDLEYQDHIFGGGFDGESSRIPKYEMQGIYNFPASYGRTWGIGASCLSSKKGTCWNTGHSGKSLHESTIATSLPTDNTLVVNTQMSQNCNRSQCTQEEAMNLAQGSFRTDNAGNIVADSGASTPVSWNYGLTMKDKFNQDWGGAYFLRSISRPPITFNVSDKVPYEMDGSDSCGESGPLPVEWEPTWTFEPNKDLSRYYLPPGALGHDPSVIVKPLINQPVLTQGYHEGQGHHKQSRRHNYGDGYVDEPWKGSIISPLYNQDKNTLKDKFDSYDSTSCIGPRKRDNTANCWLYKYDRDWSNKKATQGIDTECKYTPESTGIWKWDQLIDADPREIYLWENEEGVISDTLKENRYLEQLKTRFTIPNRGLSTRTEYCIGGTHEALNYLPHHQLNPHIHVTGAVDDCSLKPFVGNHCANIGTPYTDRQGIHPIKNKNDPIREWHDNNMNQKGWGDYGKVPIDDPRPLEIGSDGNYVEWQVSYKDGECRFTSGCTQDPDTGELSDECASPSFMFDKYDWYNTDDTSVKASLSIGDMKKTETKCNRGGMGSWPHVRRLCRCSDPDELVPSHPRIFGRPQLHGTSQKFGEEIRKQWEEYDINRGRWSRQLSVAEMGRGKRCKDQNNMIQSAHYLLTHPCVSSPCPCVRPESDGFPMESFESRAMAVAVKEEIVGDGGEPPQNCFQDVEEILKEDKSGCVKDFLWNIKKEAAKELNTPWFDRPLSKEANQFAKENDPTEYNCEEALEATGCSNRFSSEDKLECLKGKSAMIWKCRGGEDQESYGGYRGVTCTATTLSPSPQGMENIIPCINEFIKIK
tara:strand:- start:4559 stop:13873 length:9315 start_codon:yes stop_codon:yes gene_type:complete